jgi:hypothetical protein
LPKNAAKKIIFNIDAGFAKIIIERRNEGKDRRMNCQLKNREHILADYLTGELAEADMAAFEQHYFECTDCLQELQAGKDAISLIEKEGGTILALPVSRGEKLRQTFAEAFSWKAWQSRPQLAFALAALVLLVALGLPFGLFKYQQRTPASESYAENFKPSARLDDLIRQTYQSPSLLAKVEPANDATVANPIIFRWEAAEHSPQTGAWELRLMNNREEGLFRERVEQQAWHCDKTLAPGLYYWALLTENEMAYLGRFYVKKP